MASRSSKTGDGRLQLEYQIYDDESPTAAVARALGTATDSAPEDIPPLYESIEPDALDTLCAQLSDDFRIEFDHHGFLVTVTDENDIFLHPTSDESEE